ncbi:MAG: PAS domain S-box protein, partial [Cytophagales bacterium]|nr:PAS domain S-box protein [Cytophagales bacterium]
LLTQAAPVGIYQTDEEGNCLFINQRWREITGLSSEEALGAGWIHALHEDDRGKVLWEWENSVKGQREFKLEYRFRRPNGELTWVQGRSVSLTDPKGKIMGYLGTVSDITEIKKTQEALAKKERSLHEAQKLARLGSWELYPASGQLVLSEISCYILDLSPTAPAITVEEFIAMAHPDDRAQLTHLGELSRGRGRRFRIECRFITSSDEVLHLVVKGEPTEEKGRQRLVGTLQDISEVKEAEAQAKTSEANLKALIENTSDSIWAIDSDYRFLAFNSAYQQVIKIHTGRSPQIGDKLRLELFPDAWRHHWSSMYERALRGERFVAETTEALHNQAHTFEHSFNPIMNQQGQVTGVAVFSRDISLRKETELRHEHFKYSLQVLNEIASNVNYNFSKQLDMALKTVVLYLQMPLGIISHIRSEQYVVEHTFSTHAGLAVEHGQIFELGKTYCDLTYQKDDVLTIHHMGQSEYSGHPCYPAHKLETYIGVPIVVRGQRYGTVNFSALEARAEPFGHEEIEFVKLFGRWVGSTIERKMDEQDLIWAKEKAEEASMAKAQFLSTMSHEIRTPMNAVIGLTHILLQEDPKPEQIGNLKTLKFSSENLLALINDILDFSKIEAGKVEFEEVDFSLDDLAKSITSALRPKAEERGIELLCQLDPALPPVVVGDPARLSQILNNLVSNAVKFTERGYVRLSIKAREKRGKKD